MLYQCTACDHVMTAARGGTPTECTACGSALRHTSQSTSVFPPSMVLPLSASEPADPRDDYDDFSRDAYGYRRRTPPKKSFVLPIAAAITFAIEAALLLAANGHGHNLSRFGRLIVIAALPFGAMAGIGLLTYDQRALQFGLLPMLGIIALAGILTTANLARHPAAYSGFSQIRLILVYLLQWATVGFSVLIGFIVLAVDRR